MPHITIIGQSKNMMIKQIKLYAGIEFKDQYHLQENIKTVLDIAEKRLSEAIKIFIDTSEVMQWDDEEMQQKIYWEQHFTKPNNANNDTTV